MEGQNLTFVGYFFPVPQIGITSYWKADLWAIRLQSFSALVISGRERIGLAIFSPFSLQFFTNRSTHAVTLAGRLLLEIFLNIGGSSATIGNNTRWLLHVCSSEGIGCISKSPFIFQLFSASLSHSGPFHQLSCFANSEGKFPLEAQSTGFSIPLAWRQQATGIASEI